MEAEGLQVLQGPVDHLRQGFNSWEQAHTQPHPVQLIQNRKDYEWKLKLDSVRRTYGSHMAMRLATEKQTHSRMRRLPGLESSHIAVDTVMGQDSSIDFQDYLNDPYTRPVIPKVDVHGQMEIQLGLL